MELKRVVVTGLGAITPLGKTISEYWDGLKNGVSGAAPVTFVPGISALDTPPGMVPSGTVDFTDREGLHVSESQESAQVIVVCHLAAADKANRDAIARGCLAFPGEYGARGHRRREESGCRQLHELPAAD